VAPPFGGGRREQMTGAGSGFIIDSSGFIVTNRHVIGRADRKSAGRPDKKEPLMKKTKGLLVAIAVVFIGCLMQVSAQDEKAIGLSREAAYAPPRSDGYRFSICREILVPLTKKTRRHSGAG